MASSCAQQTGLDIAAITRNRTGWRLSTGRRRRPILVLLLPQTALLCLFAACSWPATADRLPDMRWTFDRALRLDTGMVERPQRVRAWAMLRLLYPQDEPGTECDDVWRMVALDALVRLDARAAGFPPPGRPAPRPLVQAADPLRDLLGVRCDGLRLTEVLRPASGLAPGDRILACDGIAVDSAAAWARLIAEAVLRGRTTLGLDQGRSLEIVFSADGPQVVRLELHGTLEPWETLRRIALPTIDGAWSASGTADPGLVMSLAGDALRAPPGSRLASAIAGPQQSVLELRRQSAGGSFSCTLSALRGAWRRIHLDPGRQRQIGLGVRAGQALVVESAAATAHLVQVQVPGAPAATIAAAGTSHRLAFHGAPGALAAQAVECNGLAVITVASASGDAADLDLRILLPTGEPAP